MLNQYPGFKVAMEPFGEYANVDKDRARQLACIIRPTVVTVETVLTALVACASTGNLTWYGLSIKDIVLNQYDHTIGKYFEAWIAKKILIPTPFTILSKATLSFRTMSLIDKPYHVKLPVDAQATSVGINIFLAIHASKYFPIVWSYCQGCTKIAL
jgi:hypothetical protein